MKALILNSGLGTRMGELTACQPKCMTSISSRETILSRQLRQIAGAGIREVVVTTGPFEQELITYCSGLGLPLSYTFIKNEEYQHTNYIYSIFLAREYLRDELILLHGDLVMEDEVFRRIAESGQSCMAVSSASALPEKDFKAVLCDGRIAQIGVDCFNGAVAAQPAYHLLKRDWEVWLEEIERFCQSGTVTCYAENAFNQIADQCQSYQSTSSWDRCKGREPGNGPHKRGLNTKLHLAVDAHGKPVRARLTAGTIVDCSQALLLLKGLDIGVLLTDKGYDTNEILEYAREHGITAVIPPKKKRKVQREYDKELNNQRHFVENAFLHLKRWRGIATRYGDPIKIRVNDKL